ncbi:type II toxin-antitoxin system RelE/ParE family toxin [Streptomyces albidoflavus]
MSLARFAFAAHPDAVADLRELPRPIRDLALLELQNLVHGSDDCLPLKGRLDGFHKVYVDPAVAYRMVIQFRPAPPASAHKREIYLVAAGSREDYAVYRAAHLRTQPQHNAETDSAAQARARAARSRSPLASSGAGAKWGSATTPAAAPPQTAVPRKALQR